MLNFLYFIRLRTKMVKKRKREINYLTVFEDTLLLTRPGGGAEAPWGREGSDVSLSHSLPSFSVVSPLRSHMD